MRVRVGVRVGEAAGVAVDVGGTGVLVAVGGTGVLDAVKAAVGVRVAVGGTGVFVAVKATVGVAVGGAPPHPGNLKLPTRVRQLKLPVVA